MVYRSKMIDFFEEKPWNIVCKLNFSKHLSILHTKRSAALLVEFIVTIKIQQRHKLKDLPAAFSKEDCCKIVLFQLFPTMQCPNFLMQNI